MIFKGGNFHFLLLQLSSLLLVPSTNSYQIFYGCLTKPNMIAFGGTIDGPNSSIQVESLEACALACTKEPDCTTFFYKESASLPCQLRKTTELQAKSGFTGGWCPKGALFNPDVGSLLGPVKDSVPLRCSSRTGKVCQFPVKVGGKVHWDCVDRDGIPVCNTREESFLQTFPDLSSFDQCGACSKCGSNNAVYEGFLLTEKDESDAIFKDVDSKEECRILCHLAEGCSFFNFVGKFKQCSLKYGVGKKKIEEEEKAERFSGSSADVETYFGPKFCPEDCKEPQEVADRSFAATVTCQVSCRLGNSEVLVPAASIGKVCEGDNPRFDPALPTSTKSPTGDGGKVVYPSGTTKLERIVNKPPSTTSATSSLEDNPKSSSAKIFNQFQIILGAIVSVALVVF